MNKQTQTLSLPAKIQNTRIINLILGLLILASTSLSGLGGSPAVYAQTAGQTSPARTTGSVAVVGSPSAPLLVAPDGAILQTLSPGDRLIVSGRTADSQWAAATTDDGSKGWVRAQALILFGLAELPVLAAPSAEASQPNLTTTAAITPTRPTVPLTQTVSADAVPQPQGAVVASSLAVTVNPPALVTATVTLTDGKLNIRTGPATTYPVIGKATNGQTYPAQARNAAGNWIQVVLPARKLGWVAGQYVALTAAVNTLPVSDPVSARPQAVAPVINQSVTSAASTSTATGLSGKLVFSTGNGGLFYLYNLATGAVRPLTSGQDPALSPDGTKIVFTRSGGENGLYLINSDGSGEQQIFGEQDQLRSPKWSPDSRWIVFSRAAGQWTCYDLGRECATREALLGQLPPAVAKDPAAIAKFLDQFEAVENPNWSIARVDASGGDYRDIPALNSARTPDWSSGGIVYQSTAGIQKTADTANSANRVVVVGHHLQDPAWRPDGGRIVYQAKRGDHWEIFSVNADGTDNVALTRPVTTLVDQLPSNVAPAWSPDGQSIVYLSNREENNSAGAWRLWVMKADGSNQRPLLVDLPISYVYGLEQVVSWGQ